MSNPDPSLGTPFNDEASMEGVLASIRRILAEEEAEPAVAASQRVKKHHDDVPDSPAEDVFVLDAAMMIEEPVAVADDDTVHAPPEHTDSLLAPEVQSAASSSLGELVRTLTDRRTAVFRDGPTIEDLVREEMRPIVKSWLDANMAPMVERLVREEIERVVRRAVG